MKKQPRKLHTCLCRFFRCTHASDAGIISVAAPSEVSLVDQEQKAWRPLGEVCLTICHIIGSGLPDAVGKGLAARRPAGCGAANSQAGV